MNDHTLRMQLARSCRLTDCFLWDAYSRSWPWYACSERKGPWPGDWRGHGRLLMSRRYDDTDPCKLKICEQEARFSFVEALAQSPFQYSPETPTQNEIQEGRMDLSLYVGDNNVCNIEFKHSCTGVNLGLREDVRKLLAEKSWGMGFYLFDIDPDDLRLREILRRIEDAILETKREYSKHVTSPKLMVHMCFLYQGFSLQRDIPFDCESDLRESLSPDEIELRVENFELLSAPKLNGWTLHRREVRQVSRTLLDD